MSNLPKEFPVNMIYGWVCVHCKRCMAPFMSFCNCIVKKENLMHDELMQKCHECGAFYRSGNFYAHTCRAGKAV
jgi:RNase P subunit RPR2